MKQTLAASALAGASHLPLAAKPGPVREKPIHLGRVNSNFDREPLIRPFGFKGGFLSEIWQTVAYMESASGNHSVGLGTQSVLWSDSKVFGMHSESGGNSLMYALLERGLQMVKGQSFTNPVDLLDDVLGPVYAYGKTITGNPNLRKTFALNALVALDNAAWMLYAAENGIDRFDDLIPPAYRPALANRHDRVVSIPTIAFTIPVSEMKTAVDDGYFFMKIKLGQPGSQREMLEKDMERLTQIHRAIGHRETPHSTSGKLPYYFDMNGRYEEKESLLRLLDHARKIGAFDQISVVEEPFPEQVQVDVSDVGVRVASDESAHTDKDARERIEMGYAAIALKCIAKTLSMTMKIAQVAHEHGIPTFCADLTVNPILVDWNKMIACRVGAYPGLPGMGLQETNGRQNYRDWARMESYHPIPHAPWAHARDGFFQLGADFYHQNGGILENPAHYEAMVRRDDAG